MAQFACTTGAVAYLDNAETVYSTAYGLFCNAENGKLKNSGPFVKKEFTTYDVEEEGGNPVYSNFEKVNELEFSVSYNAEDWTEDGKLYIYLCVCYDEILAELVARGNTDFSAFLDLGTSKPMTNDLSVIYISFNEPTP